MLILLLVAALVASGYLAWTQLRGNDKPSKVRAATPCPTPSASPAPIAADQVTVRVLNSTTRVRLAHTIAAQLRRRGFRTHGVGNARPTLAQTTVRYPQAQAGAATTLAEHLAQPVLEQHPVGVVTLVIGRDFTGLATPAQVAAAHARDLAAASPSPAPCSHT